MPFNWEDVIKKDDPYESSDFRNAAYQLLSCQVIYENAHGQGPSYRLIDRYRETFRDVFDLLGISLKFDPDYRYIAAIPTAEKQPPMRLLESLLLLVLRKAYHEHALRGNLDAGAAVLSIEELHELYRAETSRELPNEVGALRETLVPMKMFGVLKITQTDSGSDQPFDISILPGICAVVSEATIGRLTDYTKNITPANIEAKNEGDEV